MTEDSSRVRLLALQKTLRVELDDLWSKTTDINTQLDLVEKDLQTLDDAETAQQLAVQLEKDGFLMAFEDVHDRLFPHLSKIVPGISEAVARMQVKIEGEHTIGVEGIVEDTRQMHLSTLRMTSVFIPKSIRDTVNAQMVLAFIECDDALEDLDEDTLMDTMVYESDGECSGEWTGEIPVHIIIKSKLIKPNNAKRAKTADK